MTEMEIEIENEKQNRLLHRKELQSRIYHDGESTPTIEQVKGKIAELVGRSKNNIIVKKIDSKFGMGESVVHSRIYENDEDLKKYEPKYSLKKNNIEG